MRLIVFIVFLFANYCLKANDNLFIIEYKNGTIDTIAFNNKTWVEFDVMVSVNDQNIPDEMLIAKGNFPNPFTESTRIEFDIFQTGNITIIIYDYLGNEINILNEFIATEGAASVEWNGNDKFGKSVPAGVYYYTINFGEFFITKKMLIVK